MLVKNWDQIVIPALSLALGAFIMIVMLDAVSKF